MKETVNHWFTIPNHLHHTCILKFNFSLLQGFKDFQARIKKSLQDRFKDCLKHDWLDEGHTFPLMKYYTQLVWKRRVKEAMGTENKIMKGMEELLCVEGAGKVCVKILVEGECYYITTIILMPVADPGFPRREGGANSRGGVNILFDQFF